jgi:hypothetical protein
MRMVINRVEVVINPHRCGDVVRYVVELFSIWGDNFSLRIPRIECSHGLIVSDFIDIPRLSTIHGSGYPGTAMFPNFIVGMLREGSSKNWIEFTQFIISWLTKGIQVDSCVSTLQISAMSRDCFT